MASALIFLLILFSLLLIKSSDLVTVAIRRISRKTHTAMFTLSAIILALGTSIPELFVGVTSAINNTPTLSFGDVFGSNIANISLVTGTAALLAGKVNVRGDYLKRDVWIALAAGLLPIALVLDQKLGRVDGMILLSIYGAYSSSFFRKRYRQIAKEQREHETFIYRFMRSFNHAVDSDKTKEYGRLFVGIALLLFSANMIVRIGSSIAVRLGIPPFVIGLVLVAVGTSLPELVFSFRSITNHEPGMFFGNILGSTIANSTLVIGLVSFISPIEIVSVEKYFVAFVAFVVIYLSFWLFIRSKHRLDRWEGALLILLYILFVVIEIL